MKNLLFIPIVLSVLAPTPAMAAKSKAVPDLSERELCIALIKATNTGGDARSTNYGLGAVMIGSTNSAKKKQAKYDQFLAEVMYEVGVRNLTCPGAVKFTLRVEDES